MILVASALASFFLRRAPLEISLPFALFGVAFLVATLVIVARERARRRFLAKRTVLRFAGDDVVLGRDCVVSVNASSEKDAVCVRSLREPTVERTIGVTGKSYRALAVDREGRTLALASREGVEIWDLAADRVVISLPIESEALAFDASGGRLAARGEPSRLTIFETATWKPLAALETRPRGSFAPVAFSPRGDLLVAAPGFGEAFGVFETSSWGLVRELPARPRPASSARAMAFLDDDRLAIAGRSADRALEPRARRTGMDAAWPRRDPARGGRRAGLARRAR